MTSATAKAHANIALVKYWGKRDEILHLPQTGSISLTLDGLYTTTRVEFDAGLATDEMFLDGAAAGAPAAGQVRAFLDLVRGMAGISVHARVSSRNTIPTAQGLASSASGFAALALAASRAAGLHLAPSELSALARRGSGSACRSIFGGFVEWLRGARADGADSIAVQLAPEDHWDLRVVIVQVAASSPKEVSSREAMARSVETSPFYEAWARAAAADLSAVRSAVAARDLETLGAVAERNALRMHATALAADPPVVYFREGTIALLRRVWELRRLGVPAYATIDAGPHVHVLTTPQGAGEVRDALSGMTLVESTLVCRPGPGARLLGST